MRQQLTRGGCGFLGVLLASCLVVGPHAGAETGDGNLDDLVGDWKLKCVSPDGKPRECVVTLSKNGAALRGVYSVDGATRVVKTVCFERGELCFCVDGDYAGQTYTLTYKGRPQAGSIRGSVRWKFGWASGSFGFEGERQGRQVASTR